MKVKTTILAMAVLVGVSGRAAAQGIPWEDSFFVNVNFGGHDRLADHFRVAVVPDLRGDGDHGI